MCARSYVCTHTFTDRSLFAQTARRRIRGVTKAFADFQRSFIRCVRRRKRVGTRGVAIQSLKCQRKQVRYTQTRFLRSTGRSIGISRNEAIIPEEF